MAEAIQSSGTVPFKPSNLGAPACRAGTAYTDPKTGEVVSPEEQAARNPACQKQRAEGQNMIDQWIGNAFKKFGM